MPVKGLQLTVNALRQYPKLVQEDVKDAVEKTTLAIEREAIANAPSAGEIVATRYGTQKINTGINQFIFSRITNSGFSGEIGIDGRASNLAIYLEFGTGSSAAGYVPTLDKEFQIIARRYYINGKGVLIKHPFLLPAYFKHAPKLVDKIRKILKSKKL